MYASAVAPSESQTGIWTSCIWLTGLYIARAFNPLIPATKAEMLRIAAAGGEPGGTSGNFTKLAAALKQLYGLKGSVYEGASLAQPAVLAAAKAGAVVVGVAGDGYNLAPRYQDNHFGHAMAVLYPAGTTGTQLDPLAPAGYLGDSFTPTELGRFATAAIIFKESDNAMQFTNPIVTQEWDTVPGAAFLRPDGSTGKFNLSVRVKSIAEGKLAGIDSRLLDFGANHEALVIARSGLANPGPRVVGSPEPQVIEKVVEKIVEVPTGITQAQLDAAVAAARAAGMMAGQAAGVTTEKSRLRGLLGL